MVLVWTLELECRRRAVGERGFVLIQCWSWWEWLGRCEEQFCGKRIRICEVGVYGFVGLLRGPVEGPVEVSVETWRV